MAKRKNNDLQNTIQKTNDRATRTLLKPGVNWGASDGEVIHAQIVAPVMLLLLPGDKSWLKHDYQMYWGVERLSMVISN
jgi:hypothetical protein